jgi:hypothetical protein
LSTATRRMASLVMVAGAEDSACSTNLSRNSPQSVPLVCWGTCMEGGRYEGVDSGTEGVDLRTEGADSATEGVDSGTEGADS